MGVSVIANGGAEEGAFALVADSCCGEVIVKELLELMMRRHLMAFATLFV
jgi:hypothetical protein